MSDTRAPLNGHSERCTATARGSGEQCKNPAVTGTSVCRIHGGNAPQVKEAGLQRAVRANLFAELRGEMPTLGEPIYSDPVTILYDLIAISAGHVAWYRAQIERLIPDALVWGEATVSQAGNGEFSVTQTAEVNKWVELYNGERKMLADLSTRAIAAGLAEREIRLEEEKGRLLANTLRVILADLQLTPDQSQRALEVVPLKLRELTAGR